MQLLARFRVALAWVFGPLVLLLAEPTAASLAAGLVIAAAGEALRFWAAGHLHKAREVTASGPYRWSSHPLYVGSAVMGLGAGIASHSAIAIGIIALYLALTLTAAIRSEEAWLRRRFGDRYDRFKRGELRRDAGESVEEVSRFLDHSSLAVTTVYLRRLEGQEDRGWHKIAEALGV